MTTTTIFLTSGSTWAVPSDWNNASNSIKCIGGGAGAGNSASWGGGGGGFSQSDNVPLTPGAIINFGVGAAGVGNNTNTGGAAGDTWFGGTNYATSTVGAKGGTSASSGGGQAFSGIGDIKYSGGTGFSGGGGAAGPNGNGQDSFDANGAAGDAGLGGAGGASANPPLNGGAGTEFDGSHGCGGGGGSAVGLGAGIVGATGGGYGGGGGAGSDGATSGGNGYQGLIIIQYTPAGSVSATGGSTTATVGIVFSNAAQILLAGDRVCMTLGVKMELANETLLLWLGADKIRSNDGQYWTGLGKLGGISGLEFGAIAPSRPVNLTLTGLDAALAAEARAQYAEMRGRTVSIYALLFDSNMQPIDLPYLCMLATIDRANMRRAGDVFTLEISAEPIFNTKHMPSLNLVTDADQQARYPGDNIFDRSAYAHTVYWNP